MFTECFFHNMWNNNFLLSSSARATYNLNFANNILHKRGSLVLALLQSVISTAVNVIVHKVSTKEHSSLVKEVTASLLSKSVKF